MAHPPRLPSTNSPCRKAGVFLALLLIASAAHAHNPDTSYARIKLTPEAIELIFSFDLDEMRRITKVDADGDGFVTRDEAAAQAAFMRKFIADHFDLWIEADQVDLGDASPMQWPADTPDKVPFKDYQATILHYPFRRKLDQLPSEFTFAIRFFEGFGPQHKTLAYIEQGEHREDEIIFTPFDTDYTYFTETPPPWWFQVGQFLKLGVEHIFTGYDHILFLVALIVVSRFKQLVKIVTSFTVAHTITLMLAAFEVVKLPTRLIESGIAVTIMYVAAENLFLRKGGGGHRWVLTFFFGLVHGFGFANVLREVGMPTTGLVRCLISFNVGVELGQLAIVTALFPLSLLLTRWEYGRRVMVGISVIIFAFGAAWFVERAFSLGFMPF